MACVRIAACAAWISVCVLGGAVTSSAQGSGEEWLLLDVGSPVLAGSATLQSGTFVIHAAGDGLLDAADQFTFVYRPLSGDVDVRARVDELASANDSSVAGVMIRWGADPGSRYAATLLSTQSVRFQRRSVSGGPAMHTPQAVTGRWVRLARAGSVITSYVSADGLTWTAIASESVPSDAAVLVGVAVSSHDPSVRTSAWITNAVASATAPAGQMGTDVGKPAVAGRTALLDGRYTITAGGSGISDPADQFHFVYQPVAGDATITARVHSISSSAHRFATAGVMIRESLDPASAHVLMAGTAGAGWVLRWRPLGGTTTERAEGGKATPPGWVRLVRQGSQIDGFRSTDGSAWTRFGTAQVPMGETVFVGLAVSSRTPNKSVTAVLDGLSIVETAAPANRAPIVTMTASAQASAGALVAPASTTLTAEASDADGSIIAVDFYSGSSLLGRVTQAPYQWTASPLSAGTHVFRAVALDDRGASAISEPVAVLVEAPNVLPTILLTSPSAGQTLVAPASVTLTATALDADGTVAGVDFYAGNLLVGRDTSAPYSLTLSGLSAGSHTFTAVATDDRGASATSAAIVVTVVAPVQPAPSAVAFTASADHATLVSSYTLEVYAAGATPGSSAPLRTLHLGKPTPTASGDVQVGCASFFDALAPGNYVAAVVAIGSGGSARSASVAFSR